MKRLLFWILIFAGVASSVPPVRSRVALRVAPIRDYVVREVGPPLRRGLNPVYRWLAQQEMRVIARELRKRGLSFHPLPHPREFSRYLDKQRYIPRGANDPWKNAYFLTVTRDSIVVGSPGPDGERGTPDDLRYSVSRR